MVHRRGRPPQFCGSYYCVLGLRLFVVLRALEQRAHVYPLRNVATFSPVQRTRKFSAAFGALSAKSLKISRPTGSPPTCTRTCTSSQGIQPPHRGDKERRARAGGGGGSRYALKTVKVEYLNNAVVRTIVRRLALLLRGKKVN